MKPRCPPVVVALLLVFGASVAAAQASAPVPVSAASAPPQPKPGPRLLTPAQSRDIASPPGDLRPERPVTPQISIPLGKTPPAPAKPAPGALHGGPAASERSVDDAAARCEARHGEQVRAKCRDRLAREAARHAPR